MEIDNTIRAKPEQANAVNSVYIFMIKSGGKPVKRWRKCSVKTDCMTYDDLTCSGGPPVVSAESVLLLSTLAPGGQSSLLRPL